VVLIITFLTIIFGELVPKRLGQMYPERVARAGGTADELAVHRHAALRVAAVSRHRGHAASCWASAMPPTAA
jgi:hypothetical protein